MSPLRTSLSYRDVWCPLHINSVILAIKLFFNGENLLICEEDIFVTFTTVPLKESSASSDSVFLLLVRSNIAGSTTYWAMAKVNLERPADAATRYTQLYGQFLLTTAWISCNPFPQTFHHGFFPFRRRSTQPFFCRTQRRLQSNVLWYHKPLIALLLHVSNVWKSRTGGAKLYEIELLWLFGWFCPTF